MADGLNKVMLLGNLGADPELRTTAGGTVLKLRLATTESYMDRNQTRQERTEWHSVTLWGKRGEALAKFLTKGERVFIEGSIRTSSWEKDGEKRYRTEVVASNIILTGRKPDGGTHQRPAQTSPSAPTRTSDYVDPGSPPEDFGRYSGEDDDIPF